MSEATNEPFAGAAGELSLGRDGPRVRRLGFGAMRVTGPGIWGPPSDRAACVELLRRAVALGVNFIDTADAYGPGVSEELLAEALHPYPDGLLVATKGGLLRGGPGAWSPDGRPAHLRAACEASLRRLRVERLGLYQLHAVDPKVPLEDSVGALADLQREGKVQLVGLSNVSVEQLRRAQRVVTVVSVQNRYGWGDRAAAPVLAQCEREGLAFLPWYPLGAGDLARNARGPLAVVARAHGATAAQVALAWLLRKSPVMLPIPGTSSRAHLEENVRAATLASALTDDELRALDAG